MKSKITLFLKGAAMGAADVVPGVSGGTIAFITGIYERLIRAIKSVDFTTLQLLLKFRWKEFWQHIDGTFLVTLFAGILTSVALLSRIILYLLNNYSELLWSFFFGLIIASALLIAKKINKWSLPAVISFFIGASIAYYITVATPGQTPEEIWFIFLSGAIAICAMILPGISGSFILLLLGKYEFIMQAVKQFNIWVIAVFATGCAFGLLSFSHILNFLLKKYHDLTVALLTGFMVGSLNKVWPWKQTVETFIDRHGVEKPLVQINISPLNYETITGHPAYLQWAVLLAIGGFALVYLIEKFSGHNTEPQGA
ncbi:DUF368 domain-containing protein [Rapidithrix thailandica]|uniref:DUF368 domain-containing protein n=1 Tax=Rapidithrix thailandica TaxID=413964 RepID=A0AAW9SB78_9BACT